MGQSPTKDREEVVELTAVSEVAEDEAVVICEDEKVELVLEPLELELVCGVE